MGTASADSAHDGTAGGELDGGAGPSIGPNESVGVRTDAAIYVVDDNGTVRALDREGGRERWRVALDGQDPTAIEEAYGSLYVTAQTPGPDGRNLTSYAIDAQTGRIQWTTDLRGACVQTTHVGNGTVLVSTLGCLRVPERDLTQDRVTALDAVDGSIEWQSAFRREGIHETAVSNGRLFLQSDSIQAVDIDTGVVEWHRDRIGGFNMILANETIYATIPADYASESDSVVALDRATGRTRWRTNATDVGYDPLALGPRELFVFTGFYTQEADQLLALDRETGRIHAKRTDFDPDSDTPIELNGSNLSIQWHSLSVSPADSTVRSNDSGPRWPDARMTVDRSGEEIRVSATESLTPGSTIERTTWWVDGEQRATDESTITVDPPAVGSQTVRLAITDGRGRTDTRRRRIAARGAPGTERWQQFLGSPSGTAPVTDGERFYARSTASVVAVDAETGAERWNRSTPSMSIEPGVGSGVVAIMLNGAHTIAVDAQTGDRRWERELTEGWATGVAPPTVAFGVAYVDQSGLYALDVETGSIRWHKPGGPHPDTRPRVAGNSLIVRSDDIHADRGNLTALDPGTGQQRWRRQLNEWDAPVATSSEAVYVFDDDTLGAYDAETGDERWSRAVSDLDGRPTALTHDGSALYVSTDPAIVALDAATGDRRWRTPIDGGGLSPATAAGNRVYVGTNNGAGLSEGAIDPGSRANRSLIAIENGSMVWTRTVRAPIYSRPAVANGTVAISSWDGSIVGVHASADRSDSASSASRAAFSYPWWHVARYPWMHRSATVAIVGLVFVVLVGIVVWRRR
ncbi:outer membrane protein assembly factor BamB family protein [Halococcoides cellulosivorans]|uniref:outer membrane protein assembly factor BamB family protein n=1 Tax=Halococcoides cellulosivorans TaxID=1679096 RepID=UPI00131F1502|nr:PQQ-binding-like beta-propeller repeat protein [Halococcoides cellulosivorans]